jgi:hypothetical protein
MQGDFDIAITSKGFSTIRAYKHGPFMNSIVKKIRCFFKNGLLATGVCICCLFFSVPESAEPKLLAVLDLASNGSIPQKNLKMLSDKISEIVNSDSTFVQFNREMLPELFNQLALDQSTLVCSDLQCLVLVGNLIGANVVLGGNATSIGKQITIELNLIDVTEKKSINTVSMTSTANKAEFTSKELPRLVKNLLDPDKPSQKVVIKKKRVITNPFLYAGTVLAGGAAASAYYFLVYKKDDEKQPTPGPDNTPLSIDDIPMPGRGSE